MNIQGGVGRISRKGGFELCKLFAIVLFFSLWSEVHTVRMEWNFVSPYQLSQQNANNWHPLEGGDVADVDFSKGGQIAFVPAPFVPGASRYGLYNRPYTPREINVYMSKPKHSRERSSEEHGHKRKHHRHPTDDYSDKEPKHHPEHPKHHKSSKEELNDDHAEQAEVAGGMADAFIKMMELKKAQLRKHIEMRDEELNRGNVKAAKKEQAIMDIYQKQLEYLEGIEKAEEAVMNGEIGMYYDDDGAGQKQGHSGHHEGDKDHGRQDENEHQDPKDNDPDYSPNDEHKVERRSPFMESYLPSFGSSDTDTAVDTPSSTTPSTTEVSATAEATALSLHSTASASTTATVTSTSPDSESGWSSWFGSSSADPAYSPYGLLKYLSPSDSSADSLMSMFNLFSDPSNSSYLSNASTLMRIVMFFMPGTGIADQVYFTMALSKIMWEAGTMYYDGYGTTEIAVISLAGMAKAAYLSRREELSIIDQQILTPGVYGEKINIDGIGVPAFLKYVQNMKYPDLTEAQEEKLSNEIDTIVTMTYPNISPELKTTFCAGLKDTLKFLALFNVEGDLKVDNVDVNFSEVYIRMHSLFEESLWEKIKKSVLSIKDTIESKFQ